MTDGSSKSGSPSDQVDWEALARYLSGESSAEEAESMRGWLAADPQRADIVASLEGTLDRLAIVPPADLDVEGALRSVRARRDAPQVRALPQRSASPFARPAARWRAGALRAAAVVAALALGLALWQRERVEDVAPAMTAARTITTTIGKRDSLRLPDGSSVVLGPGSRLVIAEGYGSSRREVELEGEALFDVLHDDRRPFTVRAGAATIRDVGTTFAVHSDRGDGVRVAVTSGAVVVGLASAPSDDGVRLDAGDVGMLAPEAQVIVRRGAATDEDLAWTRGRLVFRDAPLPQVRTDLRRWYGIDLRIADSTLAGRHLTASFDGEPAARVLEVIGLTLGADIETRGDTAIVHAPRRGVRSR